MGMACGALLGLIGVFGILRGTDSCKFGAGCHYPCHCQNNATCDMNDGSCPTGCDDGDLRDAEDFWYTGPWSGYGCQIGNVAYLKTATQGGGTNGNNHAGLAIDGNHNPTFRSIPRTCAHPSGSVLAWWQVDLGATYVILSVNITNRGDCCRRRTENLDIYVTTDQEDDSEDRICHTIGTEGSAANINVNCTQAIIGRYVTLKRKQNSHQSNLMNICEVDVYGYLYDDCADGYYGVACGTSCNCKAPCDDISGECPGENCMEGWMGYDCQNACVGGTWGASCAEQCYCLLEEDVCDRFNGSCASGCSPEYGGLSCNLVLPRLNSVVELASSSQTLLEIRFAAWNPSNDGGHTPTGYVVQRRTENSLAWIDGPNIEHSAVDVNYTARLDNLEPYAIYYVIIMPFIVDGDSTFFGHPTEEGGPFRTLRIAIPPDDGTSSTAMAAGISVALLLAAILAIVIVILVRRRRKRGKNESGRLVDFGATKPGVNGDLEHSRENALYENSEVAPKLYENSEVALKANTADRPDNHVDQASPAVNNNAYQIIKPALNMKAEQTETDEEMSTNACNIVQGFSSSSSLSDDHIYGNQELLGRPIPIDELSSYVEEMCKRKDGFREEHVQIPSGLTATSFEGQRIENKALNRFNNICAYDHSRVVLKVSSKENGTGYINANYIHGYKDKHAGYIAAQGPKQNTIIDMWTMVWQTEANRIVMVTNLCEAGKVKCELYWPSEGATEFGDFKVALVSTAKFAEYSIMVLSLTHKESKTRPVYHFHFTGWPDNDVPDVATSLLDFRRKVRSYDNVGKGPVLVHCSAGVGRTGTFIALDYLLEQAKAEGMVDVFTYTALMRTNRMKMIQTLEQYVFVYKALLEALQTGDTMVPSNEIEARYPELKEKNAKTGMSAVEEQFVLLQSLKLSKKANTTGGALDIDNIAKNRDKKVVPSNYHRPFLSSQVKGTNDYVNAVSVDGYLERQAYIATQLPLPETVVDIWRLLYEQKCSCIITLDEPDPGDESTPLYWPTTTEEPTILEQLSVTLLKDEVLEEGILNVKDFEIALEQKDSHSVRMYQFVHWTSDVETPPSQENTLMLLDHAQRWQLRSGLGPMCFLCKYGYERCGLMIAACYMLDKLKVDREVDVFQAVKQVRIPRPQLVKSLMQYDFLFELAIAYINSCEDYANFK